MPNQEIYITAECTIMPNCSGSFIHPKLTLKVQDLSREVEETVLKETWAMIREAFTSARQNAATQARLNEMFPPKAEEVTLDDIQAEHEDNDD